MITTATKRNMKFTAFALTLPVTAMSYAFFGDYGAMFGFGVCVFATMLLSIWSSYSRCKNCGKFIFYKGFYVNPFTRKCLNCGCDYEYYENSLKDLGD